MRKAEVNGIEIADFPAEDYQPLIDYGAWRVAVLRYCENVRLENIRTMQKHEETDEVFVLTGGKAVLFLAGQEEEPGRIEAIVLQPGRAYNVKKGFWHNHILDEEGEVVIVENRDTGDENSPVALLSEEGREALKHALAQKGQTWC